jgi:hypothetical protein
MHKRKRETIEISNILISDCYKDDAWSLFIGTCSIFLLIILIIFNEKTLYHLCTNFLTKNLILLTFLKI